MDHTMRYSQPGGQEAPATAPTNFRKGSLMDIATSTLERIEQGSYNIGSHTYNLAKSVEATNNATSFYSAESALAQWSKKADEEDEPEVEKVSGPEIILEEYSVLVGTRTLFELLKTAGAKERRIGVLNFASAKNPGGGFLTGAQAQEESIARSSTIYPSLMTATAQKFYRSHKKDPKQGYYSHAMIYSPNVLLIRTDNGEWVEPIEADMLTSCAVNAGVVRRYLREEGTADESDLDAAMHERMARVLYLFEKRGVRNLVLGSFGTGVFRNRVEMVAEVWKELLVGKAARFGQSFDCVVFAVLGKSTHQTFKDTFSADAPSDSAKS